MKIKYFLITAVLATAIFSFGVFTKVLAAEATSISDCLTPVSGSNYSTAEKITCLTNLVTKINVQVAQLQAQASINITSPNNNTWTAGDNNRSITWTSAGLENKNVSIVYRRMANGEPAGSVNYLARNILATTGSYSWNIPADFVAGSYVIYIDQDIPLFRADKYWNNIAKAYVTISSTSWCYTFTEDLYRNIYRPEQIRALQTALAAQGFYGGNIDGVFDLNVERAVRDFQKQNNINPRNGRVGPITRNKLNGLYGCSITACTSFTYSDWSTCSSAGTQTKTIATSSPTGCTGGTPDTLSRACTSTAPLAVTVFKDANYGGSSQGYNVGSYPLSLMNAKGTLNDDISSVKVVSGYKVTFYQDYNFSGGSIVKTADDSTLVDDGWNDRVSSMVVEDVRQPSITVTLPNGGTDQKLEQGKSYNITWTAQNVNDPVFITLVQGSSKRFVKNISLLGEPANSGSVSFNVTNDIATATDYKIRIGNSTIEDSSDNYFSIVAPAIACTPNWQCNWSACANGSQWQTAVDSNTCGVANSQIFCAALVRACPITYSITASAGMGGAISPENSITVNSGASQTFTITANYGYRIRDVLVDNVSVGTVSTYTFSNVLANSTISATFIANATANYTLTTTAVNGTITKSPPSQTATYSLGTRVSVTAAANVGYHFVNWTGTASGTTNPTSVFMDANKSVTANFEADVVANCTDTDGGKNYNVKGVVVDSSPTAIAIFGAPKTFNDQCYGAYGAQRVDRVFEYYCDATLGYSQGEYHDCPAGCSNGACNR